MNSYQRGLAAEHTAIARLLEDGRELATPKNPQVKYDLLLWDRQWCVLSFDFSHEAWCRVQIKRAYRRENSWRVDLRAWGGRKDRRIYGPDDLEFLCVVAGDEVFLVPWSCVRARQTFSLGPWITQYRVGREA